MSGMVLFKLKTKEIKPTNVSQETKNSIDDDNELKSTLWPSGMGSGGKPLEHWLHLDWLIW